MIELTSIILAGGRGTRIAHLRPDTPKPMVEIHGRPFVEWLTRFLIKNGLRDFIFSAGYKAEQVEQWAAGFQFPNVTMTTVIERDELGTGGAIFECLDRCGDWFLALNGDTLTAFDVSVLTRFAGRTDVDCVIAGLPVPDTARYGSLDVDVDGRLTGFREKQPGAGLISAGFYLFRKAALWPLYREGKISLETEVLPGLLASGGNVFVVNVGDVAFIDMGTPETLAAADAFIGSRQHLFAD